MTRAALLGGVFALALAQGAAAAVTDVASNGFTLKVSAVVATTPEKAYAAVIEPARWWDSNHTYSGSAANLSLDARAGGCFCEKLADGGSVQHLTVIVAEPGKLLRLAGMLGPFQSVAGSGVLTWMFSPAKSGTQLELTYQITGYADMSLRGKGYAEWAKAADGMLTEQVARLKRAIETGSPDAPAR